MLGLGHAKEHTLWAVEGRPAELFLVAVIFGVTNC